MIIYLAGYVVALAMLFYICGWPWKKLSEFDIDDSVTLATAPFGSWFTVVLFAVLWALMKFNFKKTERK